VRECPFFVRSKMARVTTALVAVAGLAFASGACRSNHDHPAPQTEASMPEPPSPIADVLQAETPRLMTLPGVVGTYVGAKSDGTPAIVIMVLDSAYGRDLPPDLGGHPVEIEVSGPLQPLPRKNP
jgi:hypothetical protein